MKRDFLTLMDISRDEFEWLLYRASEIKKSHHYDVLPLKDKSIGLLFEQPSTRTRVSFEVGIYQLGGQAVYLNQIDTQLSRDESVEDTARVLSRYLNGMIIRTISHERLKSFAQHAAIPVINGLTSLHHPCQALADILTIQEKKGSVSGLQLAFIGEGNNVANSLIEASSMMGIHMTIACPDGYEPDSEISARAMEIGMLEMVRDPKEASKNADVLYTDVWISMGQEHEEDKIAAFQGFQINSENLSLAKPDAIVLHCLPAHLGSEITQDVLYSRQSSVFDQAENRLHSQKALLEMLVS
jgi:ornithine carbamoyltransferase